MKQVKITAAEAHDGLGGIHRKDETPMLDDAIADVFVARNMAILLDGDIGGVKLARAEAENKKAVQDRADAQRFAEAKASAAYRMSLHDAAPPEVQELAKEVGDGALEAHFLAEQAKRLRDAPLPIPVVDMGDDPFAEVDKLDLDARPRRGRRRKYKADE